MAEEKTLGPIFIICKSWYCRSLRESYGLPLNPFNKAIQVWQSEWEFNRIPLTDQLNRGCIWFTLHGIFMQPSLSSGCFTFLKLSIGALDSVKFVFGSINFVFAKQLILGADHASHRRQLLNLDTWSLRYKFTLENTVNTNSFIITERNRFGPCEAFLKKDMLEVGRYERILDWITIVIKRLHHVFTPAFAKP